MNTSLKVSVAQCSDKGRKKINQDFHGACLPQEPQLSAKGVAVVLTDGISSSKVSQIASETAVKSFLEDYYCTSESWSVSKAVQSVMSATNAWLYGQSQNSPNRFDKDKGYVCTFSALVIKACTAHIFYIGDTRIYRIPSGVMERKTSEETTSEGVAEVTFEQLTEDHRRVVSAEKSYLSRALGINAQLNLDYKSCALTVGDTFILATDGIYEFVSEADMIDLIRTEENLALAAQAILDKAYESGSDDNLTVQVVRIDELPVQEETEIFKQLDILPFPPKLEPRQAFDGYKILREVQITSRSYVYLAMDLETEHQVIIKVPSLEMRNDMTYLERFLLEEWIAKRINHAHVLKACPQTRKRNFLYVVTEFIEGKTLAQWIVDNPKPDVETVRGIVEQISKGLRAFHRQDMLHQDLRPNNIMIDNEGTVKIIDFGATRVAGLMEVNSPHQRDDILGTAQYTAPEYYLGEVGTPASDQFSLGVMTYQMLSGKLPYGIEVSRARTKAAQRQLTYRSVLEDDREIPAWVDFALKKAV
ncbi:MAG: bifunctional protein-serine/threonine kinase/phosphatase, partial [Gammaproteobacteria bacterium]|nr:bifunctional protein-serine/threonine kinase/phosphatase [Gammaproteobacteria bacterium]